MAKRYLVAISILAAVATLLVAFVALRSGDDDGEAPTATSDVGSFSEIQVGEVSLDFDLDAGTAVLRVQTSIDAVCAVAYGTDESFGALATDLDMGGGGHDDHNAVMRGLVPGTAYSYRLQGVGDDGRLYQSEVMRFTFEGSSTTAADSGSAPGPNIAVGATVIQVSSEFSAAFAAANAFDGSLSTEWSSAGDGDDAFIMFDLGERYVVSGVGFRTREMSDGTSITTSFTITAGGETFGPFGSGPGLSVATVEFVAQEIRIDVETSTGGNTGAVEIEVYGETLLPPPDDDM